MEERWTRAMGAVNLPAESERRIRTALALRQNGTARPRLRARRSLILIAAVLGAALLMGAAAFSGRPVHRFFNGNVAYSGVNEQGEQFHVVPAGDDDISTWPARLEEDGRLYFIGNGEHLDITDEISLDKPFIYTYEDEAGCTHSFLIGGEPVAGKFGYYEHISSGDEASGAGAENGQGTWLENGQKALGI